MSQEGQKIKALVDLQSELRGEIGHFQDLAQTNRLRAQKEREKALKEMFQQRRRAVELRAQGRSGVKIAARIGIGLQTLRRWERQDTAFRTAYFGVYDRWKADDQEAVKLILRDYHPERPGKGTGDSPLSSIVTR